MERNHTEKENNELNSVDEEEIAVTGEDVETENEKSEHAQLEQSLKRLVGAKKLRNKPITKKGESGNGENLKSSSKDRKRKFDDEKVQTQRGKPTEQVREEMDPKAARALERQMKRDAENARLLEKQQKLLAENAAVVAQAAAAAAAFIARETAAASAGGSSAARATTPAPIPDHVLQFRNLSGKVQEEIALDWINRKLNKEKNHFTVKSRNNQIINYIRWPR